MPTNVNLAEQVERELQADTRIESGGEPIWVVSNEGTLTLEGEVTEVASKRRAVVLAASTPGVLRVIDHIRVRAAVPMEDGTIRDHVRDHLVDEPAFDACSILTVRETGAAIVRDLAERASGLIGLRVEKGVVELDGRVPSRVHQRLAEVLAWWVPGTVSVDNALDITPFEEDSDDELKEAVRVVLEKEPFVDDAQITIMVHERAVTLLGYLPSDEQRRIAERDTWYVPGVVGVVNVIEVIH